MEFHDGWLHSDSPGLLFQMEDLQLCVFKMFIKCHYKLSKMYIDIYFCHFKNWRKKFCLNQKHVDTLFIAYCVDLIFDEWSHINSTPCIVQVTATDGDKDRPENIVYFLTGQGIDTDRPDQSKFDINKTTGEIFVLKVTSGDISI